MICGSKVEPHVEARTGSPVVCRKVIIDGAVTVQLKEDAPIISCHLYQVDEVLRETSISVFLDLIFEAFLIRVDIDEVTEFV